MARQLYYTYNETLYTKSRAWKNLNINRYAAIDSVLIGFILLNNSSEILSQRIWTKKVFILCSGLKLPVNKQLFVKFEPSNNL